eukprot:gene24173-9762_t
MAQSGTDDAPELEPSSPVQEGKRHLTGKAKAKLSQEITQSSTIPSLPAINKTRDPKTLFKKVKKSCTIPSLLAINKVQDPKTLFKKSCTIPSLPAILKVRDPKAFFMETYKKESPAAAAERKSGDSLLQEILPKAFSWDRSRHLKAARGLAAALACAGADDKTSDLKATRGLAAALAGGGADDKTSDFCPSPPKETRRLDHQMSLPVPRWSINTALQMAGGGSSKSLAPLATSISGPDTPASLKPLKSLKEGALSGLPVTPATLKATAVLTSTLSLAASARPLLSGGTATGARAVGEGPHSHGQEAAEELERSSDPLPRRKPAFSPRMTLSGNMSGTEGLPTKMGDGGRLVPSISDDGSNGGAAPSPKDFSVPTPPKTDDRHCAVGGNNARTLLTAHNEHSMSASNNSTVFRRRVKPVALPNKAAAETSCVPPE